MLLLVWLVCAAPLREMTAPVLGYADLTVQVDAEHLTVVEMKRGRFDKPTAMPRFRGRFTARAVDGAKTLEQVRFDVPLLADAETDDASEDARKFAEQLRKGVSVKAHVRVPLPEAASAIVIVDGKSHREVRVPLSARATGPAPSPSPSPTSGSSKAAPRGAPPAR